MERTQVGSRARLTPSSTMAEPAAAPQTIMDNKYELIKPIGKGKFAVVHRAKRLSDDSIVAVKKIFLSIVWSIFVGFAWNRGVVLSAQLMIDALVHAENISAVYRRTRLPARQ